jgi:BirA family biotin operon repressor/biotin-[acetyl-CoA-carboxylase] ligase
MPERFSQHIDRAWTNISKLLNPGVSRNILASSVIEELLLLLKNYKNLGFSNYKDEWLMNDNSIGKWVQLEMMSNSVVGFVRGIDSSGGLILEVEGKVQVFNGGEISLRECK